MLFCSDIKKQEHLGSAIYLEKIYSFHSIRPEREREREREIPHLG